MAKKTITLDYEEYQNLLLQLDSCRKDLNLYVKDPNRTVVLNGVLFTNYVGRNIDTILKLPILEGKQLDSELAHQLYSCENEFKRRVSKKEKEIEELKNKLDKVQKYWSEQAEEAKKQVKPKKWWQLW
jgi:hypothetical protein